MFGERTVALVEFGQLRGVLRDRFHVAESRQMMQRFDLLRRRRDQGLEERIGNGHCRFTWSGGLRPANFVAPFDIQERRDL